MARSINSPGIQITETDLSQYEQIAGGTTVFVPGFAAEGPTDEVLLISSTSELEAVYGAPETAAERYFYHTAKQVLNSPATLLTTRLPYGSGAGEGFAEQYSALLYPTTSAADGTFNIGQPSYITLTDAQYQNIIQNNVTWSSVTSGTSVSATTVTVQNSAVTATNSTSAATISAVYAIDPTYTLEYTSLSSMTITFQVNVSSTVWTDIATYSNNTLNAGIVVINSSKTAANENFEGYYLSIVDNAEFGPTTDFTAVTKFYGLTSSGINNTKNLYDVPVSRLGFALSATKDTAGSSSVSEIIEGSVGTYNLNQDYYNDTVVMTLFKVRSSIYEPQTLTISPVETHIGSLDSNKQTLADTGGVQRTFFLQNIVNNNSNNLQVYVNPRISTQTNWSSLSSNNPSKTVRTAAAAEALFPNSVYGASYYRTTTKDIGNVYTKVSRALTLVETPETLALDVVVDGGLTTIYANLSAADTTSGVTYDETTYIDPSLLQSATSTPVTRYKTMFSLFNNFTTNVRKDCVFIADPLRQIFVNGEDTKTLSIKSNTFSTNIYTPLKNIFDTVNSSYSVTYGNWVKAYDQFADKQVWLPISGFVAAIFARTDTYSQPWIAPAGLTRGSIPNIVDVGFNPNQKQRDFLYTISINPVVYFSGDGYVVFGQKTLQNKPTAFDRINVRRLFLVLERTVQNALKYFVFEPNTAFTRTRLKSTLVPVFELAKNTEGLYDYLIVCDERNNTPDVIDRNEVAVDIYIKPVKAAEFILVNFIATRTGQNFQELL